MEVQLLPLDSDEWLDASARAVLHQALRECNADIAAGRLVDAHEILKELGRLETAPHSLHRDGAAAR